MRNLIHFLQDIWDKTTQAKKLTRKQTIVFSVLCFLEPLYRGAFFLYRFVTNAIRTPYKPAVPVISVGNISLGGTGKTVFVRFLVNHFKMGNPGIILRGYGGSISNGFRSMLINQGNRLIVDPSQAGDEACMLALVTLCPVFVGRFRSSSAYIAQQHADIDMLILDDAYQNDSIQKSVEILLLDARKPFENFHCLPAGRLREFDITRAHIIVITHADVLTDKQLRALKGEVISLAPLVSVFAVKHIFNRFLRSGKRSTSLNTMQKKEKVALVAGIGSFSSFVRMIKQHNIAIMETFEYPDHHVYCDNDINQLSQWLTYDNDRVIITTYKDWVKLTGQLPKDLAPRCYIADVVCTFLCKDDLIEFDNLVKRLTNI